MQRLRGISENIFPYCFKLFAFFNLPLVLNILPGLGCLVLCLAWGASFYVWLGVALAGWLGLSLADT